ncbi:MAG: FxsA family protein [Nitrospirota bacterium]
MLFKLFLLFALVPMLELALLIKVGSVVGTLNTIIIVVLTAVIGAYMVKLEGLRVLFKIQRDVRQGVFPAEELIDGAMILVAGALLLTPGFITDVFGLLLIVPPTRAVIRRWVKGYFKRRISPFHFRR